MTATASTWVLIPAKAAAEGKSRLAGALCAADRARLGEAMLRHVVATAHRAEAVSATLLVGPGRDIDDPGQGLNPALGAALHAIAGRPDAPRRILVVAGDLPCLTPDDLDRLATVADGAVGIAPDRHGTGTNALSLPLPEAGRFGFRFGVGSHAAHRQEAEKLGLNAQTIVSPGLEKDIDEPPDLADAGHLFSAAGH